jgi:flagellar basal body-associated protein FliL
MDEAVKSPLTPQVPPPQELQSQPANGSYGKKKWIKWILIYAVIAAVLYGGVYYFFLAKKTTNPYSSPTTYPSPTVSLSPTVVPTSTQKTNQNPNTGNLYNDIKVRLNEVLK